jgi:hypothetical protein
MPRVDEIRVFCSYSHQDRALRDELVKHLELLRQALLIRAWHDGELSGGQDWQQEIETHLREAHVILLLVSIDFLNSQFVRQHELPLALEKHKNGEALVIPVIMRPVQWAQSGLDFLQTLPEGLRPVVLWSPQDLAYVNICEGLFAAVMVWQGRQVPARPTSRLATSVRRRVVDLALSRRVPVGKATILAVMVRRVGEGGLRAVLQADASFGISPEEVESSDSFALEFPRGADGRPASLDLGIAIESEDFSCRAPQKTLPVPSKGDSAVCVFLLEAKRSGPVVLVVNISEMGRVLFTRVLRSEGVDEARFEPAVEEVACREMDDEQSPQTYISRPVQATPSARPEPPVYASPPQPPTQRRPFLVGRQGALIACALLLAALLGAWYVNRRNQSRQTVASTAQPPADSTNGVTPAPAPGQPAVPSPAPPPPGSTPPFDNLGSAPVAPTGPATAEPSTAAPPPAVPASPATPATPPPSASALPANYQLCAFGSGAAVLSIRGVLSLSRIPNGLEAKCGFTGTGQTYDVSLHWQLSGANRSESTATATVAAGNAVSVASSGPEWAYNGPLAPGVIQVTVRSVRRSDGRENTWTGTAQLAP